MATGSIGRHNESFAETGSFGKLGVAAMIVQRLNPSWLDGMLYTDASGLNYVHDGDANISGELVKLRYQLSDSQTVSAMFLSSDRVTDIVCARIQNDGLPCGYGPDNYSAGSAGLFSLTDDALIGATSVQASIYSTSFTTLNDQLNRFVDGVADPIGSSGLNSSHGFTLNAILPAAQRHTISFTAYGSWGSQLSFPLNEPSTPYYTNNQHSDYSAFQVTDAIHSNQHLTLSESLGYTQATGGFGGVLATVAATWHPTKVDTFTRLLHGEWLARATVALDDFDRPCQHAIYVRRRQQRRVRQCPRRGARSELVELGASRLHAHVQRRQRDVSALSASARQRTFADRRERHDTACKWHAHAVLCCGGPTNLSEPGGLRRNDAV